MSWIESHLNHLDSETHWGYCMGQAPACEPVALAALACVAHDRLPTAVRLCRWLAQQQHPSGSLGINGTLADPHWPTSWAILAWAALSKTTAINERKPWQLEIDRAATFLLSVAGLAIDPSPDMGHDVSLVGWPWVSGTHSWVEPTALSILALKAAGDHAHPRVREGVRLLFDRLLPTGGCNYGNTRVFHQFLRPHLQPTGLALLALIDERPAAEDVRLALSVELLQRRLNAQTPAASLAYGALGLAAQRAQLPSLASWEQAAGRTQGCGADLHRLSLLLIALRGELAPIITTTRAVGGPA